MKLYALVALSVFSISVVSHADTASALWNRVSIVKDGQGKESLVLNAAPHKVRFADYVTDLHAKINLLRTSSDFSNRLKDFDMSDADLRRTGVSQQGVKDSAIKTLFSKELADLEHDGKFQKFAEKVDTAFSKTLEPNVIADLNNPTFFYKANWRKELVEVVLSGLNDAGLSQVGGGVIVYLVDKAIDDLISRRTFFQNYTLHYLLTETPAQLGLTDSEIALIKSSIYEARIGVLNIFESDKAQQDWPDFGNNALKKEEVACNKRLKDNKDYQNLGTEIDPFLVPAESGQNPVVINIRNADAILSSKPSLAYDSGRPEELRDMRAFYELLLLGVRLAPIPGPAQTAVTTYVKSRFESQVTTEGSLLAYFELAGDEAKQQVVIEQSVNPWILAR